MLGEISEIVIRHVTCSQPEVDIILVHAKDVGNTRCEKTILFNIMVLTVVVHVCSGG